MFISFIASSPVNTGVSWPSPVRQVVLLAYLPTFTVISLLLLLRFMFGFTKCRPDLIEGSNSYKCLFFFRKSEAAVFSRFSCLESFCISLGRFSKILRSCTTLLLTLPSPGGGIRTRSHKKIIIGILIVYFFIFVSTFIWIRLVSSISFHFIHNLFYVNYTVEDHCFIVSVHEWFWNGNL